MQKGQCVFVPLYLYGGFTCVRGGKVAAAFSPPYIYTQVRQVCVDRKGRCVLGSSTYMGDLHNFRVPERDAAISTPS